MICTLKSIIIRITNPFNRDCQALNRRIKRDELPSCGAMHSRGGGALARNLLLLRVPCHRIVRTDGKLGGFSTPGGPKLRQSMLDLEGFSILATKAE